MDLSKTLAKPLIGLWAVKKWLFEGPQIKARSADEYRHPAAGFDLADFGGGISRPIGGGIVDVRVNVSDQVMRHTPHLIDRRFRGGDLNSLIYLHRVAIDDLAADTQSEIDAERGLARRRRPGDRIN